VGLKTAPEWPQGRPIISQGDVAVGRVNIDDVAEVLIAAGLSPDAEGKTFEVVTLQGYKAPLDNFSAVFSRLRSDQQRREAGEDMGFGSPAPDGPGEAAVFAEFNLMMQLLPGEIQDPTRLEMGRTYEQLDAGKVDRRKGAAPTARERKLAAGRVEGQTHWQMCIHRQASYIRVIRNRASGTQGVSHGDTGHRQI